MSSATFRYGRRRLENSLVALEPFDPDIHAAHFVKVIKASPDLFRYLNVPPIDTEADFMTEIYDKNFSASTEDCLYAIFDKTAAPGKENTDDNYAGIANLSVTNPGSAVIEAGAVIFPAFQRTHVATNVVGLLLLWTLDPPSAGGLGLRRVEWRTHVENAASRRLASRMGFELEGIARWERVFPYGQVTLSAEALGKRNGTDGELPGRHTAIFSVVWDEWDGKRPQVVARMERKYN